MTQGESFREHRPSGGDHLGQPEDAERVEVVVCKLTDLRATATVTIYGLRDDSIRDTRHELVLDKLVVGDG